MSRRHAAAVAAFSVVAVLSIPGCQTPRTRQLKASVEGRAASINEAAAAVRGAEDTLRALKGATREDEFNAMLALWASASALSTRLDVSDEELGEKAVVAGFDGASLSCGKLPTRDVKFGGTPADQLRLFATCRYALCKVYPRYNEFVVKAGDLGAKIDKLVECSTTAPLKK
jgi:hypothetical protein